MPKGLLLALTLLLLMLAGAPARADDSLYRALGGAAVLRPMMDEFVGRLAADRRIARFFEKTNREELAAQLTAQVCQLSGGPCAYEGPTMRQAHEGMEVRRADFNALVELLQVTMDARGVPVRAQNRLLALLAPMHRDIIEPPQPQ